MSGFKGGNDNNKPDDGCDGKDGGTGGKTWTIQPDGYVEGTSGNDQINAGYTGDPEGDMIDAGDAILPGEAPQDDIVLAGGGNDVVRAGAGDDEIYGGKGNDQLYGDAGDDEIYGEAGNDNLYGGDGEDRLFGGDGNDVLRGGDGNDYLETGAGMDVAFGDGGDDLLSGGPGHDVLFGGDDRDTFINAEAGDIVDGDEGGDDFDTLDLTGQGPFTITYTTPDHENGFVVFEGDGTNHPEKLIFRDIENIVPCFTPGTLIATPEGAKAVETLREGDHVLTRDNGIQEIRWTGAKTLDGRMLAENEHLQPVLIKAGSLDNGLPERDMLVSPNHRMLVANDRTALYFEEREVLVAAKHLVDHKGVHRLKSLGTTYIHFMFDRHEVVLANGAWTESFQPGDYSLKGVGNAQRSEILGLFPELRTSQGLEGYVSARRTLRGKEARLLAV